jgi:hypothetical protein
MDAPTAAAIMTGLATVGKPAAELVKDFLGRILAPTGDAAGQAMAHSIAEWQKRRVERANDTVRATAILIAESEVEAHSVPGRVFWPLIERASLEEDEELHNRWVHLLANASAAPASVLPAFVSILGELSPLEARLLRRIYELGSEIGLIEEELRSPTRNPLESSRHMKRKQDLAGSQRFKDLLAYCQIESVEEGLILVSNLSRLGLLIVSGETELPHTVTRIRLSKFGKAFTKACSARQF